MLERFVSLSWYLAALSLTFASGLLAMVLIHRAVFQILAGGFGNATGCLLVGATLGTVAILLAKHRTDLV